MFSRQLCCLLLLGLVTACSQPAIPDTPAGRALTAWLDAFNSGDRARVETYLKQYEPERKADEMMGFRAQTGGFVLISIESSEAARIVFRVKEKGSETTAVGKIDVKEGGSPRITNFSLRAIPPGATVSDFKIDAAARARVIDGALAMLQEYYVFPDKAKSMEAAIRARQKSGAYDSVTDGDVFARMLTDNLREVSHDKHLRVNYSPAVLPAREPEGDPGSDPEYRKQMEAVNCGFDKVERLPSNIGYLKFDMFADPEVCGPTAVAAMNFLGNVDAIIFDLRENGGGDPKMIALISSYLFEEPAHLNDLYNRKENTTTQYWTLPYVPGKKLAKKPVFVLTSKGTFSGAEEFSYNLKNLKRATLVGETTGGGAHPVSGHRIDDHFMIGVPFARAINPISRTNWEGTGVEPDVKTPAAEALSEALKLAEQKLHRH